MNVMDVTEQLRQGVNRVRLSLALTRLKEHAGLVARLVGDADNARLRKTVQRAWASLADLAPEVRLIEQAAHAAELPIAHLSLAQVHRFLGLPAVLPVKRRLV